MQRQSHAAKAVEFFTELVSELETADMGFAEMAPLDTLAAGLRGAGAQLYGVAGAAAAGIQAAFGQAKAQMAQWLLFGEGPSQPGTAVAALEAQYGSELSWGRDDWMKHLGEDFAEPNACALAGLHPGEVVVPEHS